MFGDPQQSPKFELFPVSDSEFIRKDANLRYVFHSTGGKVDSFQVNSEQGTTVAPRISNDTMIPFELLMAGRATEAVAAYKTLKTQKPDSVAVSERRLNNLAYSLIQRNKLVEAIAVLKVNAELYPQSANVYDSLGEAYLASGDKELAIQNYKRSIELDPRNRNASNMLRKLGQ